jgi:hypothetical protein
MKGIPEKVFTKCNSVFYFLKLSRWDLHSLINSIKIPVLSDSFRKLIVIYCHPYNINVLVVGSLFMSGIFGVSSY